MVTNDAGDVQKSWTVCYWRLDPNSNGEARDQRGDVTVSPGPLLCGIWTNKLAPFGIKVSGALRNSKVIAADFRHAGTEAIVKF